MSTVHAVIFALLAANLAAIVPRLRLLRRRPHDPLVRALLYATVNLSVGMALGLPQIFWPLHQLLGGVPGLLRMIAHAAVMVLAFNMQIFTLCLSSPDATGAEIRQRRRSRAGVLLAGLLALAVCYVLGPLRTGEAFIAFYGDSRPGVTAYIAVIHVYLGLSAADTARLCWNHRNIEPRTLRAGLRLIAAGGMFGVLFALHKTIYFALVSTGVRVPWAESGTSGIQLFFIAPGVLLTMLGFFTVQWAPRIARRVNRYRTYRRLAPLMAAMASAGTGPPGGDTLRLRGLEARLLYRVITIRDTLLGPLQSRLDAGVYERALRGARESGLDHDESRAVAEAECIRAALAGQGALAGQPLAPRTLALHEDLESEASWLARVSHAFHLKENRAIPTDCSPQSFPGYAPASTTIPTGKHRR